MAEVKKTVLTATTILAGGLLYTGLNWIPIVGPLAAGFAVGYTLKENPLNSFRAGAYSAAVGALAIAVILNGVGFFKPGETSTLILFLAAWVLLVWNFFGILLAGVGGIIGSLAGQAKKIVDTLAPAIATLPFGISFDMQKPRRVIRLRPPTGGQQKTGGEERRIRFNICPNCGSSNPESNSRCETCGQKLGK